MYRVTAMHVAVCVCCIAIPTSLYLESCRQCIYAVSVVYGSINNAGSGSSETSHLAH